ncbi:MAG: hypothetical protein V7L21_35885 [Nostoc sp.]|uniref:hypothetical protein n=1 Tax=Nostoc sp. TaxID=1180 RepID=UPI002FFB030C|nr:hypothetical protein [Nostoc sp. NMS9]
MPDNLFVVAIALLVRNPGIAYFSILDFNSQNYCYIYFLSFQSFVNRTYAKIAQKLNLSNRQDAKNANNS